MLPSVLRSLIFVVQALSLVTPLLGKGRTQKLPSLIKEATLLAYMHRELLWKLLEKRQWSIEAIKQIFKSKLK